MGVSLALVVVVFCLQAHSAAGRWRRFKEGKFIVGGLFPITEGPECTKVRSEGLMLAEAFVYTINNDSLYSDAVLGYDIRDSCSSPVVSVKEVQDFLRNENDEKSFVNCSMKNASKQCGVLAFVGPDLSGNAVVTSGILSAYGVPQVRKLSRT